MQVDLHELLQRCTGRFRPDIERNNSWTQDDLMLRYARRVVKEKVQVRGKKDKEWKVIRQEWIAKCIEHGGTALGPHCGGWEVRYAFLFLVWPCFC
jgi:hypothetical protein